MTEETLNNSNKMKKNGDISSPPFWFLRKHSMSKNKFRVVLVMIAVLTLMVSFRIALSRAKAIEHHMDEATSLLLQGRFEESLEQYEMAMEGNMRKRSAWEGQGICFLNLGRYEEALAVYEKLLNRYPKYVQAWYWKAVSLEYLGRFDEALRFYDKAIEISPGFKPATVQRERLLKKIADLL